MALHFRQPKSLGATLGESLGTGISSGVQQLLQQRLQEMQDRKLAQSYENAGLPGAYSQLPHQVIGNLLEQKNSQQQASGLQGALESILSQQQPQQNSESQIQAPPVSELNPPSEIKELSRDKKLLNALKGQKLSPDSLNTLLKFEQQISSEEKERKNEIQRKKEELEREKLSRKEQDKVDKETRPAYDRLIKESHGATQAIKRLDKMEDIVKRGNLPNATFASLINTVDKGVKFLGLGINLRSLLGADAEEFDKLSTDFVKNVKDFFGGRITNQEIDTFLKTIPSLTQTDAGKLRVINNLKELYEGAIARQKAADEVIKENNGKRPANFETLIEEKASPALDLIAQRFKQASEQLRQQEQKEKPPIVQSLEAGKKRPFYF